MTERSAESRVRQETGWLAGGPLLRVATIKRTTDTFLFMSHTTNVLLFKFRCNIVIGVRIIKEIPDSVASGTLCTRQCVLHCLACSRDHCCPRNATILSLFVVGVDVADSMEVLWLVCKSSIWLTLLCCGAAKYFVLLLTVISIKYYEYVYVCVCVSARALVCSCLSYPVW